MWLKKNKHKAWNPDDSVIVCCNNKIRNNWICSGDADIIRIDTSTKNGKAQKSQCEASCTDFLCCCNSSTLISARRWHSSETSPANLLFSSRPNLSSGERALKVNFFLWRRFSFLRRWLFQLSACFTDHHLVISRAADVKRTRPLVETERIGTSVVGMSDVE